MSVWTRGSSPSFDTTQNHQAKIHAANTEAKEAKAFALAALAEVEKEKQEREAAGAAREEKARIEGDKKLKAEVEAEKLHRYSREMIKCVDDLAEIQEAEKVVARKSAVVDKMRKFNDVCKNIQEYNNANPRSPIPVSEGAVG